MGRGAERQGREARERERDKGGREIAKSLKSQGKEGYNVVR